MLHNKTQFLSSTLQQTIIRDCILKRHQAISELMHGFKTFSQMCCIMLRDKQRHVPPAHLGFKKHFSRYVLPSGPSWGVLERRTVPASSQHPPVISPAGIVHRPSSVTPSAAAPGGGPQTRITYRRATMSRFRTRTGPGRSGWPSAESPCRDTGSRRREREREMERVTDERDRHGEAHARCMQNVRACVLRRTRASCSLRRRKWFDHPLNI